MIPVVDLARRGARFAEQFGPVVAEVALSGRWLLGDHVAAFEREFAASLGAREAVAVASGASALQLGLTALGVGAGHEVVVPALTAVPTAAAVVAAGATPVVADVDADTACITPATIAAVTTAATAAVIAVSLYGYPTPLPSLGGIAVVEDAAQASGSPGRVNQASFTAYSFYPTKNLGGIGDGGAIVTDSAEVAAVARRLRVHGMTEQYVHTEVSQNFRMSELEAAWLRLGLVTLADDVAARRRIAHTYRAAAPHLRWQADDPGHAYHLCVMRTTARPAVIATLAAAGVATGIHYPRALTQQPAYTAMFPSSRPVAERWAAECVSVPCFPEMTESEVDQVTTALSLLPPDDADARVP